MSRSVLFKVLYPSVLVLCAATLNGCTTNKREAAPEERILDGLAKGELPTAPDDKLLIKLAADGDADELKSRLLTKEQANETTQWGLTALHYAAAGGHDSVARLLIEQGADVNKVAHVEYEVAENEFVAGDYTPIDLAVRKGREEMVALLIELGGRNVDLDSALFSATRSGNTRMATVLIESGADVDAERGGGAFAHTPLHEAVLIGDADMVELLLSRGANMNARTLWGYVPSSIVERLSGEVNYYGKKANTPLALAKMKGHTEIVQILQGRGANE